MRNKLFALMFAFLIVLSSFSVAQTSYETENIFGEEKTGESIIIEAYKYQPIAVNSNVLEEQDVPVYVFLKATTLGGLISGEESPEAAPFYGLPEIKLVSSPRITGGDVRFVSGSGVTFVPSNTARRTLVDETGKFIDLGYLIVRLKKIEKESDLPGFKQGSFDVGVANLSNAGSTSFLQTGGGTVDLNVSLDVRFDFENSLSGFGANDLVIVENANEEKWLREVKQGDSFWNGKGYVRVNRVDETSANIALYDGSLRKITTLTLTRGQEVGPISLYSSGSAFIDRFRVKLNEIRTASNKAKLLIDGNVILVGQGERIKPGSDWVVSKIIPKKEAKNFEYVGVKYDKVIVDETVLQNTRIKDTKTLTRVYVLTETKSTATGTTTTVLSPVVSSQYKEMIEQYSNEIGVDANLAAAVIRHESNFNPDAVSTKSGKYCGAVGLMQLMPSVASDYKLKTFENYNGASCDDAYTRRLLDAVKDKTGNDRYNIDERFNPEKNVYVGVSYLKSLLKEFNDNKEFAVAAYNAGSQSVKDNCQGVSEVEDCKNLPAETTAFVKNVMGTYDNYNKVIVASSNPNNALTGAVILDNGNLLTGNAVAASSSTQQNAEIKDACDGVNDFDLPGLSNDRTSLQVYCKSIKGLETALSMTDDEDLRGEANYFLGENYYSLGDYIKSLEHFESVTGKYKTKADVKLSELKLKANVITESNMYFSDEGFDLRFLGVEELKDEDSSAAYIKKNSGNAERYVIGNTIVSGLKEADGREYEFYVEGIERGSVFLRKRYSSGDGGQVQIKEGVKKSIKTSGGEISLEVSSIESKNEVFLTILPGSGKGLSTSYVNLHIPVEQRAIQFSTAQIDSQINATQAVIKKLDATINKMDTWLKRWKLACLGVYGFLTFKNLVFNSADVKARELVYHGSYGNDGVNDVICSKDKIGYGKDYSSYDECVFKNRALIENLIKSTNGKLGEVDTFNKNLDAVVKGTKDKTLSSLSDAQINGIWQEVVGENNKGLLAPNDFSTLIKNDGITTDDIKSAYESRKLVEAYSGNAVVSSLVEKKNDVYKSKLDSLNRKTDVFAKRDKIFGDNKNLGLDKDEISTMILDNERLKEQKISKSDTRIYQDGDRYFVLANVNNEDKLLELKQKFDNGKIIPGKFECADKNVDGCKDKDNQGKDTDKVFVSDGSAFVFGSLLTTFVDKTVKIDQNGRVVRLPYKNGQYIEILEWYANGNPKTFRLVGYRNVGGENVEYNVKHQSELDLPENLGLKSTLDSYIKRNAFCKSGDTVRNEEGIRFICEYAKESIEDKTQCTDVMSANDCAILFNVCDPVICPSSRFDLGGRWKLAPGRSVVDTGLFGSLTLGMPNFVAFGGENVIPPVCGPGVLASLESWRSMLQAYNECLITSKTSGQTVGICDEIRSVYLCELLWREAVIILDFKGGLLGLLSEKLSGGVNGGGEYTNFQKSLQNIGDSAKFFTQEYGRTSFNAYKARSFEEAGTEFCRSAVFAKAPGIGDMIDKLSSPESPPQFTAFFDEFEWTGDAGYTLGSQSSGLFTGNIPQQSRYKIYYHIYAGRNNEVRYSVWLQDRAGVNKLPVTNSKGGLIREIIQKGGFVDKSIDILGATGFEEICVDINGMVQCGFGKTSSGFLQNYINDVLVKNEAGKEITNEKECVGDDSVGPSVSSIALPTQAGFGTSAVRRICSVTDPNTGTGKIKWAVVGTCEKGKNNEGKELELGSCWVDSSTLNIQFKNLDNQAQQELAKLGEVYKDALIADDALSIENANKKLAELDVLFNSLIDENMKFINKQKIIEGNKDKSFSVGIASVNDLMNGYDKLREGSLLHAGKATLRIGEGYYALADLRRALEKENLITGVSGDAGDAEGGGKDSAGGAGCLKSKEGEYDCSFIIDVSENKFTPRGEISAGDLKLRLSDFKEDRQAQRAGVAYEDLIFGNFKVLSSRNGQELECKSHWYGDTKELEGGFSYQNGDIISSEKKFSCDNWYIDLVGYEIEPTLRVLKFKVFYNSPFGDEKKGVGDTGAGRGTEVSTPEGNSGDIVLDGEGISEVVDDDLSSYQFKIVGEVHKINLKILDENSVRYTLTSEPEVFILTLNSNSKRFDMNKDGIDDLVVELVSIKKEGNRLVAKTRLRSLLGNGGCYEASKGEYNCGFIMDVLGDKYTPRGEISAGDLKLRLSDFQGTAYENSFAADFEITFSRIGEELNCKSRFFDLWNTKELAGMFSFSLQNDKFISSKKRFDCDNWYLTLADYEIESTSRQFKFKLFYNSPFADEKNENGEGAVYRAVEPAEPVENEVLKDFKLDSGSVKLGDEIIGTLYFVSDSVTILPKTFKFSLLDAQGVERQLWEGGLTSDEKRGVRQGTYHFELPEKGIPVGEYTLKVAYMDDGEEKEVLSAKVKVIIEKVSTRAVVSANPLIKDIQASPNLITSQDELTVTVNTLQQIYLLAPDSFKISLITQDGVELSSWKRGITSDAPRRVKQFNYDLAKLPQEVFEENPAGEYLLKVALVGYNGEEKESQIIPVRLAGGQTSAMDSSGEAVDSSLTSEAALDIFEEAACPEEDFSHLEIVGINEDSLITGAAVLDCLLPLEENYDMMVRRIADELNARGISLNDANLRKVLEEGVRKYSNWDFNSLTKKFNAFYSSIVSPFTDDPVVSPELTDDIALSLFEEALCSGEGGATTFAVADVSGRVPSITGKAVGGCLVPTKANYGTLTQKIVKGMQARGIELSDANFGKVVKVGIQKHRDWDLGTLIKEFKAFLSRIFGGLVQTLPTGAFVIIDPGHGGADPGALSISVNGKRYSEKTITMNVANKLKTDLEAMGFKVVMTRERDLAANSQMKVIDRIDFASNYVYQYRKKNNLKYNVPVPGVYVSLHADTLESGSCNALKASGSQAYVYCLCPNYNPGGGRAYCPAESYSGAACRELLSNEALTFAKMVQQKLSSANSKKVIGGNLDVLTDKMPSTLVELGFLCNQNELKKLLDENHQEQLAEEIADGVENYFKEKYS